MTDITITKENIDARHGRYVARVAGVEGEGELTFTRRSETVISADHTGVPEALSGRGVAKALYAFLLDDARESGFRIIPVCPFVRKLYERQRRDPASDVERLFTTARS
ncbi:GNAT family N-acetyltransferase [Limimaricola cinnabarinus]|jgi:predicted GNAT family acetyltransferase|uniref:GNAT family N-acetyltransferase n=1 Tax=Limimaricola cinnabarinus TaxID=1125964 RepID=A0A2G1MDY8_9RHOB|nr:GNAT family N-acetyltransferase [Limimaricola cinnabarinus]PHP26892.1 GNAT family N-acetyltransferase [Limimaricola cinnabarinus]